MIMQSTRKALGIATVIALGLLVSACLLAPGRFVSALDIRKDGTFSFTYSGEMHMLALSEAANNSGGNSDDTVFEPEPCTGSDGVERECTPAELDRQMRDWQSEQEQKSERDERQARQMAAMMSGMDPSDPEAAQAFAANLEKQAGWQSVVYRGDGRFDVEFAISGRLTHDFVFPTVERFPMANAFVMVSVRDDGTVRIDAPGYAPGMMGGPLQGLAQAAMMENENKAGKAQMPEIDGTFTITTDAQILANNTEEGPKSVGNGRQLAWDVNMRSSAAPTALIQLQR